MFGQSIDKKTACYELKIFKVLKGKVTIDIPKLERIIKDYQIESYSSGEYIKEELHLAMNLIHIKTLWFRYGTQNWLSHFLQSETIFRENNILYTLNEDNFLNDEYLNFKLSPEIKEQLGKIGLKAVTPEPMNEKGNELALIPTGLFKGGTIRPFCMDCRAEFTEKWLSKNKCTHSVKRQYYCVRYYVPSIKKEKKKALVSRYPAQAIVEAQNILNNLKDTSFNSFDGKTIAAPKTKKIEYLSEAVKAYVKYHKNEDNSVFQLEKKNTKEHVLAIEKSMEKLEKCVKAIGYKNFHLDLFKDKTITEAIMKELPNHIKVKEGAKPSPTTINAHKGYWSSLLIWCNTNETLGVSNFFKLVKSLPNLKTPVAISDEQYDELIKWMGSNPEFRRHPKNRISRNDLNWLRQCFIIQKCLPTAVRREDVIMLQWKDLFVQDKTQFLKFINHKKTKFKKSEPIPIYTHINNAVETVLIELGFGTKVDPNDYIIMPEKTQIQMKLRRTQGRKQLIKKVSFGFSFFTEELFGYPLENKGLRKNNVTEMSVVQGEDFKVHENMSTTINHYIDPLLRAKKIAKNAKDAIKVA